MADALIDNKAIILEKKLKELRALNLITDDQLNAVMNVLFSSGIAPTELLEQEWLKQVMSNG